jgi:hypothetical protein
MDDVIRHTKLTFQSTKGEEKGRREGSGTKSYKLVLITSILTSYLSIEKLP